MSRDTHPAPTADDVRRDVKALAPAIAARSQEIETARRIPADLLAQLHTAGCFRLLLPPSHAGTGATPSAARRVFDALSQADPSVGWATAIAASNWRDLTGLPRATFDAVHAQRDRVIAGAFSPGGAATPTAGGYLVSGRWGFVTGCTWADWLYGNVVVPSDGDGEPTLRTVLFRRDEVEIEDTWRALGMRGTASHHMRVDGCMVPEERTFPTLTGVPCLDATICRIPQPSLFALLIASVAIGTARGALDACMGLAADKVPLLASSPLAANRLFHHRSAEADTRLRAADSLLHGCADAVWDAAAAGAGPAPDLVARTRAAAASATTAAVRATETAFRFAGGAAVYDGNGLQRRMRDVQVIAQHMLVRPDTLATAGAVLAGQDADVLVF